MITSVVSLTTPVGVGCFIIASLNFLLDVTIPGSNTLNMCAKDLLNLEPSKPNVGSLSLHIFLPVSVRPLATSIKGSKPIGVVK